MAHNADSVPSGEAASGSNQERPPGAWKLVLLVIAMVAMIWPGLGLLIWLAESLGFWEADVGYPVGSPSLSAAIIVYALIARWLIWQLARLP